MRRLAATFACVLSGCAVLLLGAPPAAPATKGIWISIDELAKLPTRGAAWRQLQATADGGLGKAKIRDQNDDHDVRTLAVALVYARTGREEYRAKAADAIAEAIGTEEGGRTLALARNLPSYVVAADLIDLESYDSALADRFRSWLAAVRSETLDDGKTLVQTSEERPNNWGTNAGAARAAADVYLEDTADLERAAQVFKGWLGDRTAYAGFIYGSDLSWQVDSMSPVGVNPASATIQGQSVDGALPDDMRRGGGFQIPPGRTGYVWEALQGAVVEAEILRRAGYDPWSWQDAALRRAVQYLYDLDQAYGGWWAAGDDGWVPWLVNAAYGSSFPAARPTLPGKNMGWTDWTHAAPPPPVPRPDSVPKHIPRWAWDLLKWQSTPASERGPRPKNAPRPLPKWYREWATWKLGS